MIATANKLMLRRKKRRVLIETPSSIGWFHFRRRIIQPKTDEGCLRRQGTIIRFACPFLLGGVFDTSRILLDVLFPNGYCTHLNIVLGSAN